MTRATLTIAAVAFLCIAAAANSPPVTFESPCDTKNSNTHNPTNLRTKHPTFLSPLRMWAATLIIHPVSTDSGALFGTHIKEGMDIIKDWVRSGRK
jgi:hypothetical protein